MTFGERIIEARKAKGFSQKALADALGVTPMRMSHWENDKREPSIDYIKRLVKILGVSADYLIGTAPAELSATDSALVKRYRLLDGHGREIVDTILQIEIDRSEETLTLMEFLTPVAAGTGIMFEQSDYKNTDVKGNLYTRKANYILTVSGDSMLPRFKNGDKILVEETDHIEVGEVGVFWYDGQSYLKILGPGLLRSLNPIYRDIEIRDGYAVRCEGRVLGVLDPDWIL